MKRPDNFVEDKIIKSYPTEIGSQNFKPDDISLFKMEKTTKVKKYYSTKFEEIATQYELLMKDIQINERLYKSNHNFEPVTGEVYNLYKKESGEEFISMNGEINLNLLENFNSHLMEDGNRQLLTPTIISNVFL